MKTKRNLIQICLLCAAVLQAVTSGAQPVTKIAAGYGHSLFLKSDGSLWAMGNNYFGQLGDGTTDSGNYYTNLPEQIVASGVTAIAAGGFHSLLLKSDDSLWAMGDNEYGQLGDGTYNITNLPERIVASNVTAIAAGEYHSLLLKSDGSLWAMGDNEYGQLGDGTHNSTNQPEQIVSSNVTAIAAGGDHSLFLKSDGSLWAMGYNQFGVLGDGTYNYSTNLPELIVAGSPGYNQISIQLLSGGSVRLSFVGIAGANYALDRSFSLMPANWVPQMTNPAGLGGVLGFTNTPDPTTNNFWRIRSVP
jgi:alpha-tubulin suppressor-like RCC1 family protein